MGKSSQLRFAAKHLTNGCPAALQSEACSPPSGGDDAHNDCPYGNCCLSIETIDLPVEERLYVQLWMTN